VRPANGYGRVLGRPGPRDDGPLDPHAARAVLDAVSLVVLVEHAERETGDADVATPVTP
jgi:hypothetical protein